MPHEHDRGTTDGSRDEPDDVLVFRSDEFLSAEDEDGQQSDPDRRENQDREWQLPAQGQGRMSGCPNTRRRLGGRVPSLGLRLRDCRPHDDRAFRLFGHLYSARRRASLCYCRARTWPSGSKEDCVSHALDREQSQSERTEHGGSDTSQDGYPDAAWPEPPTP
jgi:hypothetical protein